MKGPFPSYRWLVTHPQCTCFFTKTTWTADDGLRVLHHLKWFLNHCKFSEIPNKQQLRVCASCGGVGKGRVLRAGASSWTRPASAGYVFAFNQSEISPSSTTRVGVASQPFVVIVDDVQAKNTASAVPLKNFRTPCLSTTDHYPDIPFTLLSPSFYLFGHSKHNWGHVVTGDIKKSEICPRSLSVSWKVQATE